MGKQTIEQLAAKVATALDGLDMTSTGLRESSGLTGEEVLRAVGYLKSKGRIENLKGGLFHLRPETPAPDPAILVQAHDHEAAEAAIQGYEEAWHEDIQPPANPADTPPGVSSKVETIRIDGWTCYLTYADLLPPLTPDEYAALKADIQEHGMLVPLLLSQTGQDRHYHVLDGQHRLRIAKELGIGWMQIPKNYRNLPTEDQRRDLALNLNLHRRHLTPEQRQQYAVKFRQQGESLRAIAGKLNIDPMTVKRDLDRASAAGVANATPETITGADGKAYPATKPDSTQVQRDADALYQHYAGQTIRLTDIAAHYNLDSQRRTFALNFLQADGRVSEDKHHPGCYKFTPRPAPELVKPTEIPGTAALMETLKDLVTAPAAEPPSAPQESAEPAAKSAPPARPSGMTFEQLHVPAHSDDHDPDLAAALQTRLELDKVMLDLFDAIHALERRWGIRGFAYLERKQLEDLNRRLGALHGQLRGAMNVVDDLNQKVVTMINTGQPYDAEGVQA